MSRSSLTKPFRVMALLGALMLLLAAPASAAFLTFVQVVKDGEGEVDGLDAAISVAVSPDGEYVYVTGAFDDALTVFSRDGITGVLTFIEAHKDGVGGVDGLDLAFWVTVSPNGEHVYAAGGTDDAVAVFSRDEVTGKLSFVEVQKDGVGGVDGLDGAQWVAVSPDGAHVYAASDIDHAVAVFSRDVTTGKLSFVEVQKDGVGGVDGLWGAQGVEVSPDGAHVYATGWGDRAVTVFGRDAGTGKLTFLEVHRDGVNGVDGLWGAEWITVSPDGRNAYVTGFGDDALAVFSRDTTTGRLTFLQVQLDGVGGVDGIDGAQGVAVSPDGMHVYASGFGDDALAVFSRDATTGALTFLEVQVDGVGSVDGIDGAQGVAVSPDGAYVYTVGWSDSAVSVFSTGLPSAIALDVKPGSCPNPLNVKSQGKLPVAILGMDVFDVAQIAPASVRLEGVAPLRWALEDVATPYEPFTGKQDAHNCTRDGPDGYQDLTLKFEIQEIVAALGEVDDGEVRVLQLTGNLKEAYGGTPIAGEDVVVILKKGKK